MMLIYCKECPNLEFIEMDEFDKVPTCAKTGEQIEDFQKQYCDLDKED